MAEAELTYEDIEAKGIDISMVKSCKKLRQLAKLDRLKLDESTHRSGLNKHLFDYIEYCGSAVYDREKKRSGECQIVSVCNG